MYKPCASKESVKKNCPGKESSDSVKKKLVRLEILSGALVVNTNQWRWRKHHGKILMEKAFSCLDKYEICESFFRGIFSFVFEIFLSINLSVMRK